MPIGSCEDLAIEVYEIGISNDIAYLANGWLTSVNIEDPCNLNEIFRFNEPIDFITGFGGLDIAGKYVHVADHWSGYKIIESNNPKQPQIVGTLDIPIQDKDKLYGKDVEVYNSTAYLIWGGWESYLLSIDVSNPNQPKEISRIILPSFSRRLALSSDGKYAFIGAEKQTQENEEEGLIVVDISNPKHMGRLSGYFLNNVLDITVDDDLLFVSDTEKGFYIFDVSDPSKPTFVYNHIMPWTPVGVDVDSEFIYISCKEGKVVILEKLSWGLIPLVNSAANETDPIWSPDGSQIAFISDESGGKQLYIINADGSGLWQVTDDPQAVETITWSPDSQYLLYTQANWLLSDVIKVKLTTTHDAVMGRWNLTQASSPTTVKWGLANFSPDGKWITAVRQFNNLNQLYLIRNRDENAIEDDWRLIDYPSKTSIWKPDNVTIIYAHQSDKSFWSDVLAVDPNITNKHNIIDQSQTGQIIYSLAYSLNGEDVLISGDYTNNSRLGIFRPNESYLNWLDGPPAAIAQQKYSNLPDIWSSDEKSILYSYEEKGCWNIYLINRDRSNKRLISFGPGDNQQARFSVKGQIAFQTNRNENWDIFLANPPK